MGRMLNDQELVDQLATVLGAPAIFPYTDIPPLDDDPNNPDALGKPYIITEGDAAYVPENFKGTAMAPGIRDIRIYAEKRPGADGIYAVADRVATLFRSDKLQPGEVMFPNAPINLISCMSRGPMPAPVEGTFIGRLVRVEFKVEELPQ